MRATEATASGSRATEATSDTAHQDRTHGGAAPTSSRESDAARRDLLHELGYADFAEEDPSTDGRDSPDGLVEWDARAASPGVTLITSIGLGRADLLAIDGTVLASWQDPDGRRWTRCELLEDGRLLALRVLGNEEDANTAGLEGVRGDEALWTGVDILCLSPRGERLWTWENSVHHDIEPLSRNRIAVLTRGQVNRNGRPWVNDRVTILRHDANGVREGSIVHRPLLPAYLDWADEEEVLGRRYPRILAIKDRAADPRRPIDVLHANSIDRMAFKALAGTSPAHSLRATLVSLRNQNEIIAIDLARGEVLWSFGNGELRRQHEATYLPNGNVLVFDNGDEDRRWSRIVEISPQTDAIVWEYAADPPEDFFTARRGTCHILENGNVLIASSQQAYAFEITRSGRVVWKWINPYRNRDGRRSALRAERYPLQHVRNPEVFARIESQPRIDR